MYIVTLGIHNVSDYAQKLWNKLDINESKVDDLECLDRMSSTLIKKISKHLSTNGKFTVTSFTEFMSKNKLNTVNDWKLKLSGSPLIVKDNGF